MVSLRELDEYGEVWRISQPLAASITNQSLVIPKPYFAGNVNIANQYTVNRQYGIVILGFAYNFYSSGATNVTLNAYDPWVTEGTITNVPIWHHTVGAGGYYNQTVSDAVIPLSPADRRADASPVFADGATLRLSTGSNLTNGFLLIWGIHTQRDFGRQSLTGSPVDFT